MNGVKRGFRFAFVFVVGGLVGAIPWLLFSPLDGGYGSWVAVVFAVGWALALYDDARQSRKAGIDRPVTRKWLVLIGITVFVAIAWAGEKQLIEERDRLSLQIALRQQLIPESYARTGHWPTALTDLNLNLLNKPQAERWSRLKPTVVSIESSPDDFRATFRIDGWFSDRIRVHVDRLAVEAFHPTSTR